MLWKDTAHFHVTIPWQPTTWLAPKFSRGYCYDPRSAEKLSVRSIIKRDYKGDLLDEPVCVVMTFCFRPPKSYTKKNLYLCSKGLLLPYKNKKDCTNMQKLYEDCLKGIVIKDDKNVCDIRSRKIYGNKDEIKISVYTLEQIDESYH